MVRFILDLVERCTRFLYLSNRFGSGDSSFTPAGSRSETQGSLDRVAQFLVRWAEVLLIVQPETVVGWHCAGFRLYWRWRSRGRAPGRANISPEIRELIRRTAKENPTWGAPKIHGELLKLGFTVSERSVSRYLHAVQRRGDPGKRWLTFLRNHREAIVAMDFFTVPTVSFRVLYCLFIIEHARRRILYFHLTAHPNSADRIVASTPFCGSYSLMNQGS
jgi:hypothetical protein